MKHVEVVCAIIENDKDEVFICKRGAGRQLEGKWEFPGGKVEANESHEQTIIREIKEELNSIVDPYEYIGKVNYEYKNIEKPFSITLYGYRCVLLNGKLELSEHTASKWINKKDLSTVDFSDADKPFIDLI
jgi:hydrolase, NUDIX family